MLTAKTNSPPSQIVLYSCALCIHRYVHILLPCTFILASRYSAGLLVTSSAAATALPLVELTGDPDSDMLL